MKSSKNPQVLFCHLKGLLIGLAIFFSLNNNAEAANRRVFGAEMDYKYLGGDSLIITVTAYQDCSLGKDLDNVPITISPVSGSSYQVSSNMSASVDVTPVCKGHCTYCNNTSCDVGFGVKRYYITAVVQLNGNKYCNYKFFWKQCCRSASITTGAGGQGFYVECMFNKCIQGYHSSPKFNNGPMMVVCRNLCVNFLNTANAETGDSISYALVPPLADSVTAISFISGYNYTEPVKHNGTKNQDFNPPYCYGFHFDSTSGNLSFKATKDDITVLSIEADQWKKDSSGKYKLAGSAGRSVELVIMDCRDNHVPIWAKGFSKNTGETIHVYAGTKTTYNFEAYDNDGDTIALSREDTIAGSTIIVNNKPNVSGVFTWVPKTSDIRTKPYSLTLRLNDRVCPIPAIVDARLLIYVDSFPKLSYSKIDSGCGKYHFTVLSDTTKQLLFNWYIDGTNVSSRQSMSYHFNSNGTHYIHFTAGNTYSFRDYYDTIKVSGLPVVDAGPDKSICKGDSVQLNGKGTNILQWKSAPGIKNLNLTSPYVHPLKDQNYILLATNNSGCNVIDTVLVKVNALQGYVASNPALGCPGDTVSFTFDYPAVYTTAWKSSPYLIASADGKLLKAFPPSSTSLYAVMIDKNTGCFYTDTVNIKVDKDCVYPGDINKDKIVNYLDLLPLAVGLNTSGPLRLAKSVLWKAMPGTDWAKNVAGINYKHLDCDGDGKITVNDTIAISKNYGKSHAKKGDGIVSRAGKPAFYLLFDKPVYLAGDTVRAGLYLGTSNNSLSAIGAGLRYAFGNKYILDGSYNFQFGCGFICDGFSNMSMYRSDGVLTAEGSVVRMDNKASVGYGKVADISYILLDSNNVAYTKQVDTLHLQMLEEKVIDDAGNEVLVDPQSGKALIYTHKRDMPSGITPNTSTINT